MISFPNVGRLLQPETKVLGNGRQLLLFPSESTELVKLDFIFDAGHVYQPQLLCAHAAAKLMTVATHTKNAQQMAEFLDARGVLVDSSMNLYTSTLTLYTHRRWAEEVIPVAMEMITRPLFSEADFGVWLGAKRQELAVMRQRSSAEARRVWNEALFGVAHPLGRTASVADADCLTLDVVRRFHREHYTPAGCRVVVSGCIDDGMLKRLEELLGDEAAHVSEIRLDNSFVLPADTSATRRVAIEGAQQASLRVGRILPDASASEPGDYERFVMLTSLLGGYFGSRLMSNLREDKGYTYGISAHVQQYRGYRVFYVVADVAAGVHDAAVSEVMKEMQRLCDEEVPQEELAMVKSVLAGDAMRALDGVFERSDRYGDIIEAGSSDLFGPNFSKVLAETTPADIKLLANKWLRQPDMLVALAGAL